MTLHKEHTHRAFVQDGGFKAEVLSVGDDGVRLHDAMPPGYYSNATAREIGEAFLWVANRAGKALHEQMPPQPKEQAWEGYARRMPTPRGYAEAQQAAAQNALTVADIKAISDQMPPQPETVVWKPSTFYVAAPFIMKEKARTIRDAIARNTGWQCEALWLEGKRDVLIHSDDDERFAREDLEDIRNSDVLVHLAGGEGMLTRSGGRHVELGYALALGKHVVHIGQQENIFHSIVPVYSNVTDFLANDLLASKAAEELLFT